MNGNIGLPCRDIFPFPGLNQMIGFGTTFDVCPLWGLSGGCTFTQAPGVLDDRTIILPTLCPSRSLNFFNFANTLQFSSPSCCYLLISPSGTGFLTAKPDLLTQMPERGERWGPDLQEMEKKEALSCRHAGEDGVPVLMITYTSTCYYILSKPHQDFSQSMGDPTRRYSSTDPGWKSE